MTQPHPSTAPPDRQQQLPNAPPAVIPATLTTVPPPPGTGSVSVITPNRQLSVSIPPASGRAPGSSSKKGASTPMVTTPSSATASSSTRRYRVPDDLRRRAAVSCDRCKIRRARCVRNPGQETCTNCQRQNKTCESTLPRKHRIYGSLESLSLRFRALDGLIRGMFPNENTQDVSTLFRIASERNISHLMPPPEQLEFASEIFDQKTNALPDSSSTTSISAASAGLAEASNLTSATLQLNGSLQGQTASGKAPANGAGPSSANGTKGEGVLANAAIQSVEEEQLFATPQGLYHYVGPTSTFGFASSIRTVVARCAMAPRCKFYQRDISCALESLQSLTSNSLSVQGGNSPLAPALQAGRFEPAKTGDDKLTEASSMRPSTTISEGSLPYTTVRLIDILPPREHCDLAVKAYFEHVHPSNPVFYKPSFENVYRTLWWKDGQHPTTNTNTPSFPPEWKDDPGWSACILLVLLFGIDAYTRHSKKTISIDRRRALQLLRKNLFSRINMVTCLVNTQALYLLHIYEHNAGERNFSWMLLGSATRMAMTIGMHRNLPSSVFSKIEYEVRRRVWWSVYVAEKLMSVILGRPSSITDAEVTSKLPDDSFFGEDGLPKDYTEQQVSLIRMLSSIRTDVYETIAIQGRLPESEVIRQYLQALDSWHDALAPQLLPKWNSMRLCHRRSVLILHLYYNFAKTLVTRPFFLRRTETMVAEIERRNSDQPVSAALLNLPDEIRQDVVQLSKTCLRSSEQTVNLLLQLTNSGLFDCVSWFDGYFAYHSIFILALDILPIESGIPETADEKAQKSVIRSLVQGMHKFNLGTTFKIILHVTAQLVAAIDAIDETKPIENRPMSSQSSRIGRRNTAMSDHRNAKSAKKNEHNGPGRAGSSSDLSGHRSQGEMQIVEQPVQLDLFPAAYVVAPWDFFHIYSPPTKIERMEDIEQEDEDELAEDSKGPLQAIGVKVEEGAQLQTHPQSNMANNISPPLTEASYHSDGIPKQMVEANSHQGMANQVHDTQMTFHNGAAVNQFNNQPQEYNYVFMPNTTPVVFNPGYAYYPQNAMVDAYHQSIEEERPFEQYPRVSALSPLSQVPPSFSNFHINDDNSSPSQHMGHDSQMHPSSQPSMELASSMTDTIANLPMGQIPPQGPHQETILPMQHQSQFIGTTYPPPQAHIVTADMDHIHHNAQHDPAPHQIQTGVPPSSASAAGMHTSSSSSTITPTWTGSQHSMVHSHQLNQDVNMGMMPSQSPHGMVMDHGSIAPDGVMMGQPQPGQGPTSSHEQEVRQQPQPTHPQSGDLQSIISQGMLQAVNPGFAYAIGAAGQRGPFFHLPDQMGMPMHMNGHPVHGHAHSHPHLSAPGHGNHQ